MVKVYSDKGGKLKPATLPAPVLTSIGRLVRAFSEIEDALNIYIHNLARTKEVAATILMGRSPLSAKLLMAKSLAALHRKELVELTETLFFDSRLKDAKDCRNAAAHGVLLGKWGKPLRYAFLTDRSLEPVEFYGRQEVFSYQAKDIRDFATFATEWAKHISDILEIEPLREKRSQQSLLPHRKGQPKGQKNKGQASQPGASRGKSSGKPPGPSRPGTEKIGLSPDS